MPQSPCCQERSKEQKHQPSAKEACFHTLLHLWLLHAFAKIAMGQDPGTLVKTQEFSFENRATSKKNDSS